MNDVQMTLQGVVDMLALTACSSSFYQAALANSLLCIVKQTGNAIAALFTTGLMLHSGTSSGLA